MGVSIDGLRDFKPSQTRMGSRNLYFKLFLSIYLLKKLIILWRFFINIMGCARITGYWSETTFIISLKENIVFVKFFETSFGSNTIASFTEF